MNCDPGLIEYASTPTQKKAIKALINLGSLRKAAKSLGMHHSSVGRTVDRVKKKAAMSGYAPEYDLTHKVAPGMVLKRSSTFYKGEDYNQWVIQEAERANEIEILREAVEEIVDTGRGRLAPIKPPKTSQGDLLAVYPLADAHVGMMSWSKETGSDYDLKIAERTINEAIDFLVASAPPAKHGLFINLGDYFHTDNSSNQTTRGTRVDVDSRFAKIAYTGMRIKRRVIDRLLQKHESLEVWTISGNHDENTSIMLAIALEALYEREPRIKISVNPMRYQVKKFGNSLIGGAHGHAAAIRRLPGFMASQFRKEWGETKHHIWYTGHVHHDSKIKLVDEPEGCVVETFRTLAPRDSWSFGKAYFAGRDMKCDIWHRKRGPIGRTIATPVDR